MQDRRVGVKNVSDLLPCLGASRTRELHCGTCGVEVEGEFWCQMPVTGYVWYSHVFPDWYSGLSVSSPFRAETLGAMLSIFWPFSVFLFLCNPLVPDSVCNLSFSFNPVFPPADHCSDDLFFRQSSFLYFPCLSATASISLQSNCVFRFPQSKCVCSYYPSLNAFASISPSLMGLLPLPHPEWVFVHFPILNESATISPP